MKGEAILFYIFLIYTVCCVLLLLFGVYSMNHFLGSVLVGCCLFLMYYVLRFIGKLLIFLADYLLDILCKIFEWLIPLQKVVYRAVLGILYVIVALGLAVLSLYIISWLLGDCSGHTELDHVHFEKFK